MVKSVDTHDEILIESARKIIKNLYQEGKHHVGAAVRTKSGKIFTAVNLEAYIGRVAVCAEAVVIGKAISEGENEFESIVAFYQMMKAQIHMLYRPVESVENL